MKKKKFSNCLKCHRSLRADDSKKQGVCGVCAPFKKTEFHTHVNLLEKQKILNYEMKRDPSFYVGSTRRYTLGERLARVKRWESE